MARGAHRVTTSVDRQTARERSLVAAYNANGVMVMSAFAYVIWPDANFKAPQGAAYAASPIVRSLRDDGFLTIDGYGYRITSSGRRAVLNGEIGGL